MTRRRGPAAAIMAVSAAILLAGLTAGCGSGGGHKAAAAAHQAAPTTERPAAPTPGTGPASTAESAGAAQGGRQKTLPKSRLTPATGTFTDPQRDYLVGKVPVGMDPAAVLQTGQESCERIANTVQEDPKAARTAVKDGTIAYAKDAITYLCPAYRDLLK